VCVGSVFVQVLMIMFVGIAVEGGDGEKGDCDGDVRFKARNNGLLAFLNAIRFMALLSLYTCTALVVYSVFTIEHKNGPDETPPISPAMNCVINLVAQFFFVYLAIYLCVTVRQFAGGNVLTRTLRTFNNAKATVAFCPMLAILFIGLRMRALQITSGTGAPQGWAQECMFQATWAVLLQLIACLLMPCVMPQRVNRDGTYADVEMDEDGNVATKDLPPSLTVKFLTAYKYFCMFGMYGGAVGIVVALVRMTPQNANGQGHLYPFLEVPHPVSASEAVANAAAAPVVGMPSVSF
jgi:hypothetical protein